MLPTEPAPETELDLRDYLRVLRRRWLTIFLITAVVVAAAAATSLTREKVYAASGDLLIRQTASEAVLGQAAAQVAQAERSLANEIQVLKSRAVEDLVAEDLGFRTDIGATAVTSADVIRLRATSTVPAQAAEIVNTYARVYIDYRARRIVDDLVGAQTAIRAKRDEVQGSLDELQRPVRDLEAAIAAVPTSGPGSFNADEQRADLQRQIDTTVASIETRQRSLENQLTAYQAQLDDLEVSQSISTGGGPSLINQATASSDPVSPKPLRNGVLALLVGLMLGVGIAFLREYLDDSVRDKEDVELATGLATLALVPKLDGWKDAGTPHVAALEAPMSPVAEAYRSLRTSIRFASIDQEARLIQLTSPSQSEGKTTTLANLGVTLAQAGQTVCLVCCDLRRPRLNQFFDLPNTTGFTTVLLRECGLDEAVQPVPQQLRLSVLTSGPIPPNPAELLHLPAMATIFSELLERYDMVLLDSPPVLPVTDAMILSGMVEGTVLVTSAGKTTKRRTQRAMELLQQVRAPLLGTVLNGVKADASYGYQYGYYAADTGSSTTSRRRGKAFREKRCELPVPD